MSKNLIYIFLVFVFFSCSNVEKENNSSISFKIEKSYGDDYQFIKGIDNLIDIKCDSNYFVIPFFENEELLRQKSGWFHIRTIKDSVDLILNFYDVANKELRYTEHALLEFKKLPNPMLVLLPCDSLCNSLNKIRNVSKIRGQLYYYGIDIQTGISECQISVKRDNKIIKSIFLDEVNFEDYRLNKEVASLLEILKVEDVLVFDRLKSKLPDGTIRELNKKEILITG